MNVKTNTFCAGGASLGDGRWINVGGNVGVTSSGGGVNSNLPCIYYDGAPYYDYDGGFAVRFLRPCAATTTAVSRAPTAQLALFSN